MNLHEYKQQFATPKSLCLNNAGLSLLSKPAFNEIQQWSQRFLEEGPYCDSAFKKRMEWARSQVAELVGADADEIAFMQSCAWGINQFAFGIPLSSGDEILLLNQEYSSNLYPWKAVCELRGARLVELQSDPEKEIHIEDIEKHVTKKTKVITVSWIQYQTGAEVDLQKLSELCQARKILFFVDATQALGIHKSEFTKLKMDGFACSSHKWLNSPVGVGILAIRKELALQMQPIAVGSESYEPGTSLEDHTHRLRPSARRFEAGSKQALDICALGASAEMINSVTPDVLKAEAIRLADILKEEVLKLGYKVHSPFKEKGETQFVNFSGKKETKLLLGALMQKGFHAPPRGPGLRLSPHAFNSDNDIDRFIEILKTV